MEEVSSAVVYQLAERDRDVYDAKRLDTVTAGPDRLNFVTVKGTVRGARGGSRPQVIEER